jgi:hypothetical protein
VIARRAKVPKFLVLYKSSATAAEQMGNLDPAEMEAGMALWAKWTERAGDAIVDVGTPLGDARAIPSSVKAGDAGHIGGFSILQGQSIDDVAAVLEDHPHFHSPGASIEVLEFLSMPGMET